jgi:hypothetical protein
MTVDVGKVDDRILQREPFECRRKRPFERTLNDFRGG